jgi:transcriptional regulator with XRE-family HTH domain
MTNIAKLPSTETTVGYVAGEIRAHAARKGLSGRQLAFQLGKSQPWMSRRLTGEIPFDVEELDAVAAILNVAPRELFPGADNDRAGGMALSDSEQRFVLALRASNQRTSDYKAVDSVAVVSDLAEFRAAKAVS